MQEIISRTSINGAGISADVSPSDFLQLVPALK
jgi:hypothetical protein